MNSQNIVELDAAQRAIWAALEQQIPALIKHRATPQKRPLETQGASRQRASIFSRKRDNSRTIDVPKSIYLWGDVGRGKTILMRRLAGEIPTASIVHFHVFMREIHESLHRYRDKANPVFWATRDMARQHSVLCLDEFLVSDITDAMILAKVLQYLEQHQVVLFTTSNFAPSELYKNGLQRSQFLPAIAHIEEKFSVLHLDHDTDYRLRDRQNHDRYFVGDLGASEFIKFCETQFDASPDNIVSLEVQGRDVEVIATRDNMLWANFAQLCATTRSQLDYLELCERFDTIFLSEVPIMQDEERDITRRFMVLIDVLYDKGCELYIAADAPMLDLYAGQHWAFEFDRTASRLQEMSAHRAQT